jgi:hypothetical protein
MNLLKLRTCATMILASHLSLLGMSSHAIAAADIPTEVVGPPRTSEYPDPICSKCTIIVVEDDTASGEVRGLLSLTYHEDIYLNFDGYIELTLLADGTEYTEIIPDVELSYGEHATWSLPSRARYSWQDVELVQVELVMR